MANGQPGERSQRYGITSTFHSRLWLFACLRYLVFRRSYCELTSRGVAPTSRVTGPSTRISALLGVRNLNLVDYGERLGKARSIAFQCKRRTAHLRCTVRVSCDPSKPDMG